jgi:radical SAM protein with 4Fe4S-binding SPASM domain
LAGGKFIEDEEKIIGIKASYNLSGYLNIINNNKNFRAGCSNCEIKNFCMQGCYGAQFESTGDPFSTIPSVCSLLKSKFYYLINKYNETGILNIILNKNFENYNGKMAEEIINYLDFMNIQLKKGENINE